MGMSKEASFLAPSFKFLPDVGASGHPYSIMGKVELVSYYREGGARLSYLNTLLHLTHMKTTK